MCSFIKKYLNILTRHLNLHPLDQLPNHLPLRLTRQHTTKVLFKISCTLYFFLMRLYHQIDPYFLFFREIVMNFVWKALLCLKCSEKVGGLPYFIPFFIFVISLYEFTPKWGNQFKLRSDEVWKRSIYEFYPTNLINIYIKKIKEKKNLFFGLNQLWFFLISIE